jgi:hypothetical protein
MDADWAITVLEDALDEAIAPIDLDRNTPQENADHLYASLLARGWTLVHVETMASHFRVEPGVLGAGRRFVLDNAEDHDWLAGYFKGYHAVEMLRNDRKVLVERCFAMQRRITAHHRRDRVTARTCEVCPHDD